MLWALRHGEAYQKALEAGRVPKRLRPPPILPGFEDWLSDFWELSADRQIGMGLGPIPAASIARHVAGWEPGEAEAFRRLIRAMDGAFLKFDPTSKGAPEIEAAENPARAAFRMAFG